MAENITIFIDEGTLSPEDLIEGDIYDPDTWIDEEHEETM